MDHKKSIDKINKLYDDLNYFDIYGGSVIIFFILIIILIIVCSYISVLTNIQPIKDNWAVERCNPKIIPFAGFINKPDNATIIEFTQFNFNYCMQNILTSITGNAVEPLTYITAGLTAMYSEIADSLNSVRVIISNIRTNIESIAKEIMGRILNIMTPIQTMLISFVDFAEKVQGIFVSGIYTSFSVYYTLQSVLGAILQFIVMILMILAGLLVGMWIVPFTWPAAITGTMVFLSISIPLLIIMVFMNKVMHIQINSPIPSLGQCFDKNTQILLNDGTFKIIEKINVGDILANNNIITAKLKLDATNVDMFLLGNTKVSGSHQTFFKGKWIFVKDHPFRIPILNYKEDYIYCLNTSLKTITIDNILFSDWDEVFDDEKEELFINLPIKNVENIHKFYDGGFFFGTKIEFENGESREICDVNVGDILKNGEKVYGIVEVYNNLGQNEYNQYNLCGINVYPIIYNQSPILEKEKEKEKVEKKLLNNHTKNLYHLLTDKNYFSVNNIKYYHYNSCIELFLEKYRGKLLSMKYV
jgi:hypothetical protein